MKKITWRWLVNSFGVVLLIVVVMVIAIAVSVHSYYYNGARQFLLSRSDSVATLLENYSKDSSADFSLQLRRVVEDYEYKDRSELMAIDGDKNVIITSSGFEPGDAPEMPDYDRAYSSQTGVGEYVGYIGNEKVMAITVMSRIISDDLSAMRYVVSLTRIDRQIGTLVLFACLLGAAILLFVLYSSIYFINSIVIPIGEVGQTAKQIAQGDFGVRLDVEKDDEIGELCASINNMAEELSNSEKVKNDFISSVSHELRTPLTAISGWAETLYNGEVRDAADVKKGMGIIVSEAQRLTRMVEELLEFSRMETGRFNLSVEPIDILAELEDAVYTYREFFRRKNLELDYTEGGEELPLLSGDPERLRQVFCNLLDNADKHGGSGGRIEVSVGREEDHVVIRIRDHGPGVPEDELPYIKYKFYKGSSKARGSGIGLAVCDEIINSHNGTLDIGNAPGGGCAVTIRLPIGVENV